MTTASSPPRILKAQADKIAMGLKALGRGEKISADPACKIEGARERDSLIFAIAMDDKVIKFEIPWITILEASEAGLSEFILRQMRGARDTIN